MAQLVELQKHEDEFKKLDAELIFVFREESDGVDGLKKIRDKTKTSYTLALDFEKKSSKAYSAAERTYENFVIDKSGVVRGQFDGSVRVRATAQELLKALQAIESKR